jgi:predicted ATPase/DNA-binding winged helix-turn-helix (wHTH) protein
MTLNESTSAGRILVFGDFRLLFTQRLLLEGDRPVRLGSRALEILFVLVEQAGNVVPKNHLMARVWPGIFVEEGTLRVHIASLRKALGDNHSGMRFIENVTGLGYRFVAPVAVIDNSAGAAIAAAESETPFPLELIRIVGRAQIIGKLVTQVPERRLVSIVGAGGIGKTALALAVADRLRASYRDGVHFVSLGGIADPGRVASAVASVFRQPVLSEDPLPRLAEHLGSKQLLVVFDNCEHVIGAAAIVAEYLLRCCEGLQILATSREPLRAAGEWVHRLAPLELPNRNDLSATQAMRFSAIQLFVERATAGTGTFQLNEADVSVVVDICQKLDGLPLAIELAAGCVDRFGLRGLATRLDDRLQVLKTGRRTALGRHQTLRATLDWSYDTLASAEQRLLRAVGVFANGFDARSAARVAGPATSHAEVSDTLADLTAKSLIVADFAGDDVVYRLLNTTRVYALEKLENQGEARAVKRRHAELCRELAWSDTDTRFYSPAARIDDIRGALDWCFSTTGDPRLGAQIILSSAELWIRLAFLDEYAHRVDRALRTLAISPQHDLSIEMELNFLLSEIVLYMRGNDPAGPASLNKAYQLASRLQNNSVARECLVVLHGERVLAGDYRTALLYAEQWRDTRDPLVSGKQDTQPAPPSTLNESSDSTGDRMIAVAHHLLGDQAQALMYADGILQRNPSIGRDTRYSAFKFDDRASALGIAARVRWIQGFPDQAIALAYEGIERATALNNVLSTCYALSTAATIHVWSGNHSEACRVVAQLDAFSARHSLTYWRQWARCIEWGAKCREGPRNAMLTTVDGLLLTPGHHETLVTFDDSCTNETVIARAEQGFAGWCAPEIFRARAVTMPRTRQAPPDEVEAALQSSLTLARQQGALSWELRAAFSLAQLWAEQNRAINARDVLNAVIARFSEGFGTADLIAAKKLVKDLSHLRAVGRRA